MNQPLTPKNLFDIDGNPIFPINYTSFVLDTQGKTLDEILKELSVSDIKPYDNMSLFPQVGSSKYLYIDMEKNAIYRYDESSSNYIPLSNTDQSVIESKHTHDNKSILDAIQYALDDTLKNQYDAAYEHSTSEHAPIDAQKNVQSDWNEADEESDAFIQNKPLLGSAASSEVEDFATAEQGEKADIALQGIYIGETLLDMTDNTVSIPEITGSATSILYDDLVSDRVIISDENGKIAISNVAKQELEKLSGLTIENNIQEEIDSIKSSIEDEVERATSKETSLENQLTAEITRATEQETLINQKIETNKLIWDDKYTKNEIDNKFSALETATDWKESVATYDDILTTYPEPEDGWTVNVNDTNITYRYDGEKWISISANAIPTATQDVDGLLSAADKVNYDDANSKKHTHNNLSVLETITQTLINGWNSAYSHISNKNNPHGVTKEQIGLGNVPNVSTDNQTPTFTRATTRENIASGETLSIIFGKIMKWFSDLKTVAFTGSYNDLINAPTEVSAFENDAGYITSADIDTSSNHVHANKSVLDQITQEDLNRLEVMTGATSTDDGTSGMVPVPKAGSQDRFLRVDGTWQTVTTTDTKVTNTLATTTKAYITGTTSATTNTGTQVFDTGVYLGTTAGQLVATKFTGILEGNANTATKLQTARTFTIGNANKTFDGSSNVSYTLDEIGASPKTGSTSLSKLASTITLGDGAAGTILQYSATYQQKFEIMDNSSAGDGVFRFSQSSNEGSTFTTLMEIRDDGNIVANKFTGTLSGNASTASKLQTARKINGTSFDGSSDITTSSWGTARTFTIGNTSKGVNGSENVSWSLSEIGAASTGHTHDYLPLAGGTMTGDILMSSNSIIFSNNLEVYSSVLNPFDEPVLFLYPSSSYHHAGINISGILIAEEGVDSNSNYLKIGAYNDTEWEYKPVLGATPTSESDANTLVTKEYVDNSYLPLSGGTVNGETKFTSTTASTSKTTGSLVVDGGVGIGGQVNAESFRVNEKWTINVSDTGSLDFVLS